jgi:hypothetical protein
MGKLHQDHDGQYNEQEMQRRFVKALKAALTAPPKLLKSMSSKGGAVQ